ncbi:class I SAM-dependent methyltransferase [Flagellimonas meishanensis]|uniref:class I SAM-dependent methyltransferase n=1 Tax=Flagellimonas meishanensis TaxID=2873264 RepID=UPI001CA5F461|nr:class I SAM-dependent methyltransferase [[Muricauda] meishanensis]
MKLFLKTRDFSVTGEPFELHWDSDRDMLVTHPQPTDMDPYYDSEAYISHTDAKESFTDKLYQTAKQQNLKNKIQLIDNQTHKNKSLLDIGAGTGDFLIAAKSAGYQTSGVEPNTRARQLATDKGITLQSSMKYFEGKTFGVITLWHVLEHLPDLERQIQQMIQLLEEQGTLIIAVPNFKSFDAKYYGTYWAGYDVPRHLWHFSKTTMAKLFKKHDFEIVATRPMWFDAFYVSMLSEKYKGSRLYLLRAFLIGFWSNLMALFTEEHSSLIYILKKRK